MTKYRLVYHYARSGDINIVPAEIKVGDAWEPINDRRKLRKICRSVRKAIRKLQQPEGWLRVSFSRRAA